MAKRKKKNEIHKDMTKDEVISFLSKNIAKDNLQGRVKIEEERPFWSKIPIIGDFYLSPEDKIHAKREYDGVDKELEKHPVRTPLKMILLGIGGYLLVSYNNFLMGDFLKFLFLASIVLGLIMLIKHVIQKK